MEAQVSAQFALWQTHITLGEVAYREGDYTQAEKQFAAALAVAEAFGPEEPRLATSLNNLGNLYRAQGRYAEAEPLYQRALPIYENALGPEHPYLATSLENYAALLRETGRGTEASKLEARAKAIEAMRCPRCATELQERNLGRFKPVVADYCPGCQGMWLDKGELYSLDESVWVNIEEEVEFLPPDTEHGHVMCPNCGTACEPLSPKDLPECIIDRCPSCEGFWLDKDELDELRDVVTNANSEILEDSKWRQERERQKQDHRSVLARVLLEIIYIALY